MREFSEFLIISFYVNFQEFILIFKGILLRMIRENGEKVQTYTVLMDSRIAGSGFGLVADRIGLYWKVLDRLNLTQC